MFLGTYTHALDAKGRLSIPKKFLEPLADPSVSRVFFGTRGLERCIFLFLSAEWHRTVEQVRSSPLGSERARRFSRRFYALARELPVDGSGRIRLPAEYRELAGIERDVLLVGVDQRIELWSPDVWAAEEERNETSYEEQAEGIFHA